MKNGVELFTAVATMKFGRLRLPDSHEAMVLRVYGRCRRKASAADFEVRTALTEVKDAQYAAMAVVALSSNPFAVPWDKKTQGVIRRMYRGCRWVAVLTEIEVGTVSAMEMHLVDLYAGIAVVANDPSTSLWNLDVLLFRHIRHLDNVERF